MLIRKLALTSMLAMPFTVNASPIQYNAVIQDHGSFTRDLSTALDWMDVTATRGLSYNQVDSLLQTDEKFKGWRYATVNELDALVLNFGYVPLYESFSTCPYGNLICDYNMSGDNVIIEDIINILGDVTDAFNDARNHYYDVGIGGAGGITGILGSDMLNPGLGHQDMASFIDREYVDRSGRPESSDGLDMMSTLTGDQTRDYANGWTGSFLVREYAVPEPSALSMFVLGAIGMLFRRKARI